MRAATVGERRRAHRGLPLAAACALLLASCAQRVTTRPYWASRAYHEPPPAAATHVIQGTLGISNLRGLDTSGGGGTGARDRTFPMAGGAFQRALRDGPVQFGIEGGFTFGFDRDRTTVSSGNGAIVVRRDDDVFLLDGFIGAYLNVPLRPEWRLYAGVGPVVQYARVDVEVDDLATVTRVSENGFGGGYYARAGLEFAITEAALLGLGVRWLDSSADLGRTLGDLSVQGVQVGLTLSQGF
ncbi:MAG: hypothetical protein AAGB93_13855 [Planctomycetota bacterium]